MNEKVLEVIREYNMLAAGDTVIAAVSGGADSVALLHFLHTYAVSLGITLRAVHVNHGIRGEESDRDEGFVRGFCERLGVPLDVMTVSDIFKKAKDAGQGLEEYARAERYAFFDITAKRYGAKTATAHTQSDSMETTLFNMARGTGLRGLMGIPPVRGAVIRPLIRCTRGEIEAYCTENNLAYVTDSTNLLDDCARNRIRHNVIPALRQVHAGCDAAYSRMARHLAADDDFIETAAKTALESAKTPQGLCTAELAGLHTAVGYRAAAIIFKEHGLTQHDTVKAELLLGHLGDGHYVLQLRGDKYAEVKDGFLNITDKLAPVPYFEIPVKEGRFKLNNTISVVFTITNCEHSEQTEKYYAGGLNNALDYDKIYGEFVLRQKKDGDKILLAKRGVTKSLKKLFYEAGLSAQARQTAAVLADENGAAWVQGFGAARRTAVTPQTKRILTISIEENEQL